MKKFTFNATTKNDFAASLMSFAESFANAGNVPKTAKTVFQLTDFQRKMIVKKYQSGKSIKQIESENSNLSYVAVRTTLAEAGITVGRGGRVAGSKNKSKRNAVKKRLESNTVLDVALLEAVSKRGTLFAAEQFNMTLGQVNRFIRNVEIKKAYASNVKVSTLAEVYGLAEISIYNILAA